MFTFRSYKWLLSPNTDYLTHLFTGLETFLIKDQRFLSQKGKIFRTEVGQLMSLVGKEVKIKKMLRDIFKVNMFKYSGFPSLMKFIKREISPLLSEEVLLANLTKSEINEIYNDPANEELKKKMEARLLSYFYLFLPGNFFNLNSCFI